MLTPFNSNPPYLLSSYLRTYCTYTVGCKYLNRQFVINRNACLFFPPFFPDPLIFSLAAYCFALGPNFISASCFIHNISSLDGISSNTTN